MKFTEALNLAFQGKKVSHNNQSGDWFISSQKNKLLLNIEGEVFYDFSVSNVDIYSDWFVVVEDVSLDQLQQGEQFTIKNRQDVPDMIDSDGLFIKIKQPCRGDYYGDKECFVNLITGTFHAELNANAKGIFVDKVVK